jgi:hypothetical protein
MEKWKTIDGFKDYEVSDLGRVRRATSGKNTYAGRILAMQKKNPGGYAILSIRKGGKMYPLLVHLLVAKAFLPNPKNLPEVNHLGNKMDARATQLEWRSKAGQELYAMQNEEKGQGVEFEKRRKHWVAYLHCNYKKKYLGSFPTKREALAARRAAVKALPEII